MLDYIWVGIMVLSMISGCVTGKADAVTSAVFSGASNAVTLCISLAGCICFFNGIMSIAEKSGFAKLITVMLKPVLHIIFPGLDLNSEAANAVAMNISANMLGLGNAATPFGLKAMKLLSRDDPQKNEGVASDHMITFVVMNTASLQIIPTTIAMLRTRSGSSAPLEIMPCVWIASLCAVTVGVMLANILSSIGQKRPSAHAAVGV